jgi:Na+/serine symporter
MVLVVAVVVAVAVVVVVVKHTVETVNSSKDTMFERVAKESSPMRL